MKFPIIENAKRQARMVFKGLAIPVSVPVSDSQVMDGVDYVYSVTDHSRHVMSEKVLKFNRKALKNMNKAKKHKVDPRVIGGVDSMIVKVGKPGSRERVEALSSQYAAILACGEEVSPFAWKE